MIGGLIFLLFSLGMLAMMVLCIAGIWRVFAKAGEPGWACLVPIWNLIVLVRIAGVPGWYVVLLFFPLVNIVGSVLIGIGVAKAFGQSEAYGVGLAFLAPIFYPLLGFGPNEYIGPGGIPATPRPPDPYTPQTF
ncbi:MAG: DUF5684 domain-containing protein [Myxococcota bacterium]